MKAPGLKGNTLTLTTLKPRALDPESAIYMLVHLLTFKFLVKTKGLFTRREGYPSKLVTLALTHFLFFSLPSLQGSWGYQGRWVTLSAC